MPIHVALNHVTTYKYDRPVTMYPHTVRLRPAPHCRTPILGYSLNISPKNHFINWQQDAYGNYLARLVFNEPVVELKIEVDLVAQMTIINPFDFFIEEYAEKYPFTYEKNIAKELAPYFETLPLDSRLGSFVSHIRSSIARPGRRTIDVLVEINQLVQRTLKYDIRLEPGVQTPEETLTKCHGSCRDFTWLMVQALRHLGYAARFVSGYSIQLVADVKALDGPSGVTKDVTDLHAWTEVYIPGAGWIGLDSTSGLMCGEGHIPLAATADPGNAAPISGGFVWPYEEGKSDFDFKMSVTRIHEDPRVTKPYTPDQWETIQKTGRLVDAALNENDVRLTMGGEPTFVSIDDMEGAEWNTAALGNHKRKLAGDLIKRLRKRIGKGALLHYGQGKWYPGEPLPRWALSCIWRKDGVPIWEDESLIADEGKRYNFGESEARAFIHELAENLGVTREHIQPGHEDVWYYLWKERRLPVNVDPFDNKIDNPEDRKRLAKVFEQGLSSIVGYALPIAPLGGGAWRTGPWFLRSERMYLLPGDSPMGFRLPLDSLPWVSKVEFPYIYERDPLEKLEALEDPRKRQFALRGAPGATARASVLDPRSTTSKARGLHAAGMGAQELPGEEINADLLKSTRPAHQQSAPWLVRTALCVEPRNGTLHVFMPPVRNTIDYLDLVAQIEHTASTLKIPVVIEGYPVPHDSRLSHLKVTPDPGVIEVNVQPSSNWDEAVEITSGLYEDAHFSRLGTEKFQLDGKHAGTGGGNHVILGGATPNDSPFLRRPDLLRSLLAYWHNHPALTYVFSGQFVGPTSQSPRVDEGRRDSIYELETAFKQIPDFDPKNSANHFPSWLVDRVFRNLLTDISGNTHRAEFCIDKLFSPDSSSGRLGLVEFRGFEMPPHAQMSLTQQLLLRALTAWMWKEPYEKPLVRWGTDIHDRWMLPHFIGDDLADVCGDLKHNGFPLDPKWFAPHTEFRFPVLGTLDAKNLHVELRSAIEPWYVLGEEGAPGGTARYVDSSVERLQVLVQGMVDPRHKLAVNGIELPLHPTGRNGEFVCGVRYRAWQPPSCLHPTIPIHSPLTFDIYDTWNNRAVAGCTYHVTHPGGRSYDTFPVNANEAESRRTNRFFKFNHTPGRFPLRAVAKTKDFPFTLDLRRT